MEVESKQSDQLNYILGQYIAAGVNDPKNYPKDPALTEPIKTEFTLESFQQIAKSRWEKKE